MLRFIEKHGIHVRYIAKPFVQMRAGGRAGTLKGMLQGNREIVRAFHANGMALSPRFFCARIVRRVHQLLNRPDANAMR